MKGEHNTLRELGAQVLGISVDSVESHQRFCEQIGGCPFPLASDADLTVARLYDVVGESGSRSRRAIYVIDQEGAILHKIPRYQPVSASQFMGIFEALGLE